MEQHFPGSGLIDTPPSAERLAASWMRENGFPDARTTPAGADRGIDVWSSGAVAQVKWGGNGRQGAPAIQNLFGARGHQVSKEMLFFTGPSGGYTDEAVHVAEQLGVALFRYDTHGTVFWVNDYARDIYSNGRRQRGHDDVDDEQLDDDIWDEEWDELGGTETSISDRDRLLNQQFLDRKIAEARKPTGGVVAWLVLTLLGAGGSIGLLAEGKEGGGLGLAVWGSLSAVLLIVLWRWTRYNGRLRRRQPRNHADRSGSGSSADGGNSNVDHKKPRVRYIRVGTIGPYGRPGEAVRTDGGVGGFIYSAGYARTHVALVAVAAAFGSREPAEISDSSVTIYPAYEHEYFALKSITAKIEKVPDSRGRTRLTWSSHSGFPDGDFDAAQEAAYAAVDRALDMLDERLGEPEVFEG